MKKIGIITAVLAFAMTAGVFVLRCLYSGDDGIKSAEMKITGLKSGIAVEYGDVIGEIYVSVPDSIEAEEIISVSSDPKIAYIKLYTDDLIGERIVKAEVIAVSPGIAELYLRTADEAFLTEKYEINVIADETVSSVATGESETSFNNTDKTAVYITPSGTKYHLSSSCAGENCTAVELYEAVSEGYEPCKNCAMK